MIKDLPASLINAVMDVMELDNQAALNGEDLGEDSVSKENVPDPDEPEMELSGKKEEVIINPEYKTFNARRRM
jgi:hypothetical protein